MVILYMMSALSNIWFELLKKKFSPSNLFYSWNRVCSTFKKTILLPKTEFPHYVNALKRVERDRHIEKESGFDALYVWQQKYNEGELYVLHDGPIYANGRVHIGHAVNKILKDITLRHKVIQGSRVHFVPGWDCHGLPIELKVIKNTDSIASQMDKIKVRKKAYEFLQKAKSAQLEEFKKWGLLANWNDIYVTCYPDYVINQLKFFYSLYEKGLVYQDYKPVFWSPCNRTSLAEAELVHNTEHKSRSVYMKFPVEKCPDILKAKLDPFSKVFLLIWTTTPWSLPANQAICFAANKKYCLIESGENKEILIVAAEMVPSLMSTLKTDFKFRGEFEGIVLKDITYSHPLYKGKELPVVSANHVTMSKGTGLVHMAPNHGLEDYCAAQEHKIAIDPCLVGDDGCFLSDAGEDLVGKSVLAAGNEKVIDMMRDNILCLEEYVHSYPYDWRSNQPVIIRGSHQWFVDVQTIKEQAKERLNHVEIIPESFKKTFYNQLEKSPQWCISRQRAWGVPIPVFYDRDSKSPFTHKTIIEHLCRLIKEKGIHCWWELSDDELLPTEIKQVVGIDVSKTYERSSDILDIWFDSGVSWNHVLPDPKISDVCIEGVDQIRGWFHSSLLSSVALRNIAPYKKLFLHGFTTDAEGCKMSKSKGNVILPTDITDGVKKKKQPALGADVLRWWVASHACQHENIAVKTNIMDECAQNILKFRNTYRFLLGNLRGFDIANDKITFSELKPLDQYMLTLLNTFLLKVESSYNAMQYKNVSKDILNFVTNDISSFYCQLVKDRLYCEAEHSLSRRSCLTVLSAIFDVLSKCLAPIVPHLAEEAILHHPDKNIVKLGIFKRKWDFSNFLVPNLSFPVSVLWAIQVRNTILKCEKRVMNFEMKISGSENVIHHLQVLQPQPSASFSDLCELFQVSKVSFNDSIPEDIKRNVITLHGKISSELAGNDNELYTVILMPPTMQVCPRCRLSTSEKLSTLCRRCHEVVHESQPTFQHSISH